MLFSSRRKVSSHHSYLSEIRWSRGRCVWAPVISSACLPASLFPSLPTPVCPLASLLTYLSRFPPALLPAYLPLYLTTLHPTRQPALPKCPKTINTRCRDPALTQQNHSLCLRLCPQSLPISRKRLRSFQIKAKKNSEFSPRVFSRTLDMQFCVYGEQVFHSVYFPGMLAEEPVN